MIRKKIAFPISYGLTRTGLPIIPVIIGKNVIHLIVDTGATHCLIDTSIPKQLGCHAVNLNRKNSIMGIEGNSDGGKVYEISFQFENQKFIQEFVTKNMYDAMIEFELNHGLQVHGILGNDFLVKNKWIIDFDNLKIYVNE